MLKLKPQQYEELEHFPDEEDYIEGESDEEREDAPPAFTRTKGRNWSAIVSVTCLGFGLLNTLGLIALTFSYGSMASRPLVMVQTQEGKPLEAKQVDYLSRTDQTLKDFIRLEMSLLWNWESFDPSVRCEDPSKDRCHRIKVNNRWVKIPSTLVAAQEGLERTFRRLVESF